MGVIRILSRNNGKTYEQGKIDGYREMFNVLKKLNDCIPLERGQLLGSDCGMMMLEVWLTKEPETIVERFNKAKKQRR